MSIYAKTYLVGNGQQLTVTGDDALHNQYAHFPVQGEEVEGEIVAEEAAVEEIEEASTEEDAGEEEASEEASSEPAGNASRDEWYEYRLSQGHSEESLAELGRDALRDLDDQS